MVEIFTCTSTPPQVEGVGPTGLRGIRSPCMYVARACLFDRAHNRFIGNVMGFKPQSVLGNDSEWVFDQKVGQSAGERLGVGL